MPDLDVPLVSIMCSTYNQEQFIGAALDGILSQDYPSLEIVVPDDGSTDRTVAIVREYGARSPHPIRIIDEEHVGITHNVNRGLPACRGKYVAFTAGDDILLPGKVSAQVRWMEHDERRVLCGHDVEAFDSETGDRLFLWSEPFPMHSGRGAKAVVASVPYCGTAIMVRRSAIPAGGFDERLPIMSDWKFWIDCLHPDGEFGHVEGVFARYRRHSRNITNVTDPAHLRRMFAEVLTLFALVDAEYPTLLPASRRARAGYILTHARKLWGLGERRDARAYLAEAARVTPFPVVRLILGYVGRRVFRRLPPPT